MKVAIHQPQCWPWLRYIHKVASCDVFVYLDTVQFTKNGLQNRNQIKTATGAAWLTVPVARSFGQAILEAKIADSTALQKQWKTFNTNYASTNGFQRWGEQLHRMLISETDSLCEFAISSTEWILDKLGITTRRLRASEILGAEGHGSELIASICAAFQATSYLSGSGALDYMNRDDFRSINCELWIQDWNNFEYPQAYPEVGFVPDLSAIDLLLNCPDSAMELINSNGGWRLLGDTA